MPKKLLVIPLTFICLLLSGCSKNSDPTESLFYEIPPEASDGLTIADASEEGFDVSILSNLMQAMEDGEFTNVHSILIAKNGKLVFESYHSGTDVFGQFVHWNRDIKHRIHSASKSVVSALVGIALEENDLDLNTKLFEHFPEFDFSDDPLKMSITVGDALNMASGLQWDEWSFPYEDPRNDHEKMYLSGDWVNYVATRPMAATPGETFVYNSGVSILLGDFVQNVTGRGLRRYAQNTLFGSLGITDFEMHLGPNGVYQMGGGISLKPRDLLKFGMLFEQKGQWDGQQVVSEEWVNTSTRGAGPNSINYARHWWITNYQVRGRFLNAFLAAGRGGQYSIVVPDLDLVVVFTGGNDNTLASSQPRKIMTNYILPSQIPL